MSQGDYATDYQTGNLVKLKIWGLDFWVTPRFVKLYAQRLYEPVSSRVVLAIQKKLKPDDLILDLGAHLGYYSLLLASRGKQPVVAVEPIKANTIILEKNLKANRLTQVRAVRAAVSDKIGEREIRVSVASDSSSFNPHPTGPTLKTEPVPTTTIDVLAEKSKVGLIKIDVEGHELAALRGGIGVIKRDQPAILVEYHPESQRLAGRSEGELLAWLLKLDYRLWAADEDQVRLVPLKPKTAHSQALAVFGHEGYGNILALTTPLPDWDLNRFPIPGVPAAAGRKLKLEDTGIGLVAQNIPKVSDWDRWWLVHERDVYKKEFERVDNEVKLFKKKWVYRVGQMVKKRFR